MVPQGNVDLRAVAQRIRQRVAERTGAQLPIVEANDDMDFRSPPQTHLIAVGCLADNPLLRVLYYQFYTFVDRWYPGQGGYALHTVHGKPEVLNGTNKGKLYVRRLPSRQVLWTRSFGDTVTDLGLVPAASGQSSDIIASIATGYVTRLDAAGNRLWTTALPDEVLCLTVLGPGHEGQIVCGCEDGGVYVLRLDGSIVGRVETGGRVRCVAALDPERAVAGSDDGVLYGLRVHGE